MSNQIPNNNGGNPVKPTKAIAIALEFGFIIAVPLVLLTLGGKWLAIKYTNNWYFYASIPIAIISSSTLLVVRIYRIYKELIEK